MKTMKKNKEAIENLKIAQEEKRRLFESYCRMHNRAPVYRRDFLAAGIQSFAAYMFMPTLFSVLGRSGVAAAAGIDCPKPQDAANRLSAFITLNLSGGAAMGANFVPRDRGGQLLGSYNKMGMGSGSGLPLVTEFGNASFAGGGISKMLTGIRERASAATLSRTAFVGVCVRSQDDTSNNTLDASGLVAKAGLIGERLPNLGTQQTDTGVNQRFAYIKPPNPLRVGRYSDIAGALSPAGTLATLNNSQKAGLFNLIEKLSDSQKMTVEQYAGGNMLANLVGCATGTNVEQASAPDPGVDVRNNAQLAPVWQVAANTNQGQRSVVFGSMVLSALTGKSGSVALEMGGYDYHDNSRTTGDARDLEAGRMIGTILESAAVLGQKVFLYVTSDGSVVSEVSDSRSAPWTSDRGDAGVNYMIAYNPGGRPSVSSSQLGYFTTGQAADDKFITGGNTRLATAAVFANYLKFNNRANLFEKVLPGIFTTTDMNTVIKFG